MCALVVTIVHDTSINYVVAYFKVCAHCVHSSYDFQKYPILWLTYNDKEFRHGADCD